MRHENLFDLKSVDNVDILSLNKYTRQNSKINLAIFIIASLALISALIISVVAILKVENIQEEVEYLRWEMNQLKSDIIDSDLIDDIRKFENEEMYPDDIEDHDTQTWFINDGDDLESDYDINYDDDQNHSDTVVIDDDENISSPDQEDMSNIMQGGNFTKIGKETSRSKRNVVPSTPEGVPINSESYSTMKRKNKTSTRKQANQKWVQLYDSIRSGDNQDENPVAESSNEGLSRSDWNSPHGLRHYNQLETNSHSSSVPPVLSRRSRVMHAENKTKAFRRIIRKPRLKSGTGMQWEHVEGASGMPDDQPGDHRRRNRHRQRNNIESFDERPRSGRARMLPAIHFSGDTSKYVVGQHTNFNGNGHLRHSSPTYVDWIADDWVKSINMDQYFQMQNGNLKIKENGLYLVYSQIFYLDEHDTNGYRVYKNKEIILQCTTMTHSVERVIKGNTCYTAGLEVLNEGDEISVQDLGTGRYSIFEPGKSFFGVIKMADIKVK